MTIMAQFNSEIEKIDSEIRVLQKRIELLEEIKNYKRMFSDDSKINVVTFDQEKDIYFHFGDNMNRSSYRDVN